MQLNKWSLVFTYNCGELSTTLDTNVLVSWVVLWINWSNDWWNVTLHTKTRLIHKSVFYGVWDHSETLLKPGFWGFETLWKRFWNPLETLLKPFGNPFETLWNPFETLSKRFETLWKPFETLGNVGTLWKPLRNLSHTLWKAALKMSGEKYSCSLCSPSTCWRMRESTACYKHIYILQTCYFAVWLSTDLFIVMEIKSHNACEILWQNFPMFTNVSRNTGSLLFARERSTTRVVCMFELDTNFSCEYFVCFGVWFGIYSIIVFKRSKDKMLLKFSGKNFGRLWNVSGVDKRSTTRFICMFAWDANFSFEDFVCFCIILCTFCIT